MNHSIVVLRNLVYEIVEHLRDLISLMFRKWGNFFRNSEIGTKSKSILRYLSGDYFVGDKESKKNWPMLKDIGGLNEILDELIREILDPFCHPEVMPQQLRLPSGILLHGPSGCGKTMLANAIANETGVPFYQVVYGANIRAVFSEAYATSPSIVFIDEIDAIGEQMVTQLLICMNESRQVLGTTDHAGSGSTACRKRPGYVLVIGATNRPYDIDPALRKPGRFDRAFALGYPDENARTEILSLLSCNARLDKGCNFDFAKIARVTPGFLGADLSAVVGKAGNLALTRWVDRKKANNEEWWRQLPSAAISMGDFEDAIKMIRPRIEGFSAIPNVKWEDVGGLDPLRKVFEEYIIDPIKHREEFGVNLEQGFLLYGPTGCGKTLIAKAIASESGANFIHINGFECLNKRGAVQSIFSLARTCSPCIIFFDHLDALAAKLGEDVGWVAEQPLTQLIIELDRADKRQPVFVIGATDRPEVLGEAIKRRGRLGKHMYVSLPGPRERGLILKVVARNKPISEDVDLIAIGQEEAYENLSGADLAAVAIEAAMIALEEKQMSGVGSFEGKKWMINKTHFDRAVEKIQDSTFYFRHATTIFGETARC